MEKLKLQSSLSPILGPFGFVYGLSMGVRRSLFRMGLLPQLKQDVPTVSVGNISWGGTGKTPIVEFLAEYALKRNLKATILTRGYGGNPPYTPLIVNPAHTPAEVGDEPLMLSENLPLAAVVVDPNRSRAAKYTKEKLTPDIFILDDAFQHLHIERHLDLVLFNYNDLQNGWNKVIPHGTWREPSSALEDAGAFLIKTNRSDWDNLCELFTTIVKKYKKPFFAFSLQPVGIVPTRGEKLPYPSSILKDSPYAFVCGLGNPTQAKNSVIRFMEREPNAVKIFPDHHKFTHKDAISLMKLNMPIICTHKDAVKLKLLNVQNLWYLKTKTCFGGSLGTDLTFEDWFTKWWEKQNPHLPSADKTGLLFEEGKRFNGSPTAWGETNIEYTMPETYTLPQGWGPVITDESQLKKKIVTNNVADEKVVIKKEPEKVEDEKRKVTYAYVLEENRKKVEKSKDD